VIRMGHEEQAVASRSQGWGGVGFGPGLVSGKPQSVTRFHHHENLKSHEF
jgi:hypothetical protein